MFAITLKVILAFVLTAIPFAFHLWVKPRQASSTKWGNLYSVLSAIYERMNIVTMQESSLHVFS